MVGGWVTTALPRSVLPLRDSSAASDLCLVAPRVSRSRSIPLLSLLLSLARSLLKVSALGETGGHPGGYAGFAADLLLVLGPWLLRLAFFAALCIAVYRGAVSLLFLHSSPSAFVSDFATFEAELGSIRKGLVEALGGGSGVLAVPFKVLAILLPVVGGKLGALFGSSAAAGLLGTPCAVLAATSYLASMWRVGLVAPLLTLFGLRGAARRWNAVFRAVAPFPQAMRGGGAYRAAGRRAGLAPGALGVRRAPSLAVETTGNVERWELTLRAWEFDAAETLNGSGCGAGGGEGGGGGDDGVDPSTGVAFLPERFLLAEAGDYAKGLQRWKDTLAWCAAGGGYMWGICGSCVCVGGGQLEAM